MNQTIIKVENVGKLYRLGEIGTGSISHDLNRWWAKVQGKEDPFTKVGEMNDHTKKSTSDYVWSLKDVSFDVKQGEVLGIIGRNGAGKSTLLKILSKVTTPTEGNIKIKGRIASLLEVGTGFHPELTGRENIFLNGAILGMTKGEIKAKFDEIVDFSGVERYIDTPVKRYSSGMYVRLAFAVAAFLEPEILIVDEVLAVGDAEFQKKCLGRMKDVSTNDGRTVLFVSHNMSAVRQLCNKGLVMRQGMVSYIGDIDAAVYKYNFEGVRQNRHSLDVFRTYSNLTKKCLIRDIRLNDQSIDQIVSVSDNTVTLSFDYEVMQKTKVGLYAIIKHEGRAVCWFDSAHLKNLIWERDKGSYSAQLTIPHLNLTQGIYSISVGLQIPYVEWHDLLEDVIEFEVPYFDPYDSGFSIPDKFALFHTDHNWVEV